MKHLLIVSVILAALLVTFAVTQFLIIKYRGTPVPIPDIPRGIKTVGSGEPLTYAIMGDSTSISQGSAYEDGFAVASINHLAKRYEVTSLNTGISGATAADVVDEQLNKVVDLRPDIVLLSVGANDATRLTKGIAIYNSVQQIINRLKQSNPDVKIIVTGSPAMDSVIRFPVGSKQIMGLRTQQVNAVYERLINDNDLIHAPIAQKTRDAFIADPTLTASDQFHPNKRGYALWFPVINRALDEALERKN